MRRTDGLARIHSARSRRGCRRSAALGTVLAVVVALAGTAGPATARPATARPATGGPATAGRTRGANANDRAQLLGHPVSTATASGQRFVVRFADGSDVGAVTAELQARLGVTVVDRLVHVFPGAVVEVPRGSLAALAADPHVARLERSRTIHLDVRNLTVGPDVLAAVQTPAPWGLDRIDQRQLPLSNTYDAPNTGTGVTAYIMDTGIRADHVEFGARVLSGVSTVGDGMGSADCWGHGTAVAALVGGTTYGVAKTVSLVPVRIFDCDAATTIEQIVMGLEWVVADHAVDTPAVLNMSFGGPRSAMIDDAVNAVIDDGVTAVASAGNEGDDSCLGSPAAVARVVTVAVTDKTDAAPEWSNYGPCVDLFAPGVDVPSAAFDSTTATGEFTGTSASAPNVTGVVAALLGAEPTLTPVAIGARLILNATPDVVDVPGPSTWNRLVYSPVGPPVNDNFAAASAISLTDLSAPDLLTPPSGFVDGGNVGATTEAGEPVHGGVAGGSSLWWEFTAIAAGTLSLSTRGTPFESAVAVYTGTSVDALVLVAEDTDTRHLDGASLTFTMSAGETYHVAVDGLDGATGYVKLRFYPPAPPVPANDNFADATVISLSDPSPLVGSTVSATRELGEPSHFGWASGRSVWVTFTVPATGMLELSTEGSNFDAIFSAYTGIAIDDLTLVTNGSDTVFPVKAGTVLWVAIDGYGGDSGTYRFQFGPPGPLVAPSQPLGVVVVPKPSGAMLTWLPPASPPEAEIVVYWVEAREAGTTRWFWEADILPKQGRKVTLSDLTNGTLYEFRVTAASQEWAGIPSDIVSTIAGSPLAPTRLRPTGRLHSLSVTWSAPSSANGAPVVDYVAEYRVAGTEPWTPFLDATSTARTVTITGLTPGLLYEVHVAAVNSRGRGPFSATSTPARVPAPPSAPLALVAIPRKAAAALSWQLPASTNGASITDYIIEYRESGAVDWTPFPEAVSSTRTRTVSGLVNGTTYEFHVAAVNLAGTGAFADLAAVTAGAPNAPAKPRGVAGIDQVRLTWSAPTANASAITDYAIEYRATASLAWIPFADGVSTAKSATVTGLTTGVPYVFRVAAINGLGQGPWSAASLAKTPL